MEKTVESPASAPRSHPGHGRFEPGERLGTRYRIVALLGRGGMGEVYRADDLELGQSVALKFLPAHVIGESTELERFRREVRVAREIAHPNVCRTYDIAEEEGNIFLVMEYVDGEDLASVLRRLGRPSREKAVEIARQLCLGVAAAHENGVLHRDLKPANIMIDGRGRVRVTDFGLSGLGEELAAEASVAGTPSYMAPEQLSGQPPVTTQSDLYALGLVLYEIFTGKRVHDTNDIAELKQRHSESSIATPSSFNDDIDPAVERVILQCLEREQSDRPVSAYAVLAALPGGDPLAAALAAGETPSPELVASAGGSGSVRPAVAVACAAIIVVAFVVLAWLNGGRFEVLEESAGVLTLRSEEVLAAAGISQPPRYSANGFSSTAQMDFGEGAPPLVYWHRWSPRALVPSDMHVPRADLFDPPQTSPGSARVLLDSRGNLIALQVVADPEATDEMTSATGWPALLEAAGADPGALRPVSPSRVPAVRADTVAAWEGEGVTYLLASVAGRAVHFSVDAEWGSTFDLGAFAVDLEPGGEGAAWVAFLAMGLIPMIVSVLLSWNNLRSGRGDLRGAFWLAALIFVAYEIESLFAMNLGEIGVRDMLEALTNGPPLGHALVHAAMMWFGYVAIEPYVRRWWPRMLVSWARLVSGRPRDPIVGRDILAGGVLGVVTVLLFQLIVRSGAAFGLTSGSDALELFQLLPLSGVGVSVAFTSHAAALAILSTMLFLTQLFVTRLAVRSNRAAVIVTTLLYGLLIGFFFMDTRTLGLPIALFQGIVYAALFCWVAVRFGFIAVLVGSFIRFVILFLPWTTDLSAWYAGRMLPGLLVIGGLLVFGFFTALAGQAIFRDPLEESAGSSG